MSNLSTAQLIRIHTLLKQENLMDVKPEIVKNYTTNGTASTKDLTFDQANRLIVNLGGKAIKDPNSAKHKYAGYLSLDNNQHKRILSLLFQLQCTKSSEKRHGEVSLVVDTERFGKWVLKSTAEKKPIKELTPKQVSKVIYQLEIMLYKKHT